jgi:hypothetical protein
MIDTIVAIGLIALLKESTYGIASNSGQDSLEVTTLFFQMIDNEKRSVGDLSRGWETPCYFGQ